MSALAAIHVAKKQLGLDDATYRSVLMRVTGKSSAGQMNETERRNVVQELRRQGFKPLQKGLQGPFAAKLQALWIAAYNLGIVRDRRDAAMLAFVKRQSGIDHVRFLQNANDARKVIEALKSWMAREAGVDWSIRETLPPLMNDERFAVAWAQFRLINPSVAGYSDMPSFQLLAANILETTGPANLNTLSRRDWQRLMNGLGKIIRKYQPAGKETSDRERTAG